MRSIPMASGSLLRLGVAGLLLLTACKISAEPTGTDILVFIDFSGSVGRESKSSFERDIQRLIVPSLSAGDRILIAPIHGRTLTGFSPLVDTTFPANPEFSGWSDNVMKHKLQVAEIATRVDDLKKDVVEQVSELFKKGMSSKKTDIFSSLILAEKIFHNRPTRKVLILMSDMIVDYPPYRFDRIEWDAEKTEEMLSELNANGLIASLSGVCVYVSGATASSAQQATRIDGFWQAYFERAEADMDSSRYAHVLLHWPPSGACSQG
jgi:hypothetical protein